MTGPASRFIKLLALASVSLLAPSASLAETRFVRAGLTTGNNTGTSWINAFRGRDALTRALAAAVTGDQLWVAAGTYSPVLPVSQGGTGLRTTSFVLKNNVQIFGGFAGTETDLTQRSHINNPTVLTGDINQNDVAYPSTTGWTENSHHLVTAGFAAGQIVTATAILDGFTLRQGHANGSSASAHDRGSGIIILSGSAPTLRNLTIINNRASFGGGGLYINASSPRLEDCRVESNNGGSFGGGCDMATNCNPVWLRCTIIANTAQRAGGVEAFSNCQPQFLNCLFARNSAGSGGGGGLFLQTSTATLRNCTIVFNSVSGGGLGAAINGTTASLFNSIVASNTGAAQFSAAPTQSFTCIPGGPSTNGNISATPLFISTATNDFRLAPGSPGIDAASNALLTAAMLTDLAGLPRQTDDPATTDTGAGSGPIVDMGCHEFVPTPPPCPADFNQDATLDPDDLADFIAAFFTLPPAPGSDFNTDGTTDPDDLADFISAFFTGCP